MQKAQIHFTIVIANLLFISNQFYDLFQLLTHAVSTFFHNTFPLSIYLSFSNLKVVFQFLPNITLHSVYFFIIYPKTPQNNNWTKTNFGCLYCFIIFLLPNNYFILFSFATTYKFAFDLYQNY